MLADEKRRVKVCGTVELFAASGRTSIRSMHSLMCIDSGLSVLPSLFQLHSSMHYQELRYQCEGTSPCTALNAGYSLCEEGGVQFSAL